MRQLFTAKVIPYLIAAGIGAALLLIFSMILRGCRPDPAPATSQVTTAQQLDSVARLATELQNKNGQLVAENKTIREQSTSNLQRLSAQIFNLEKDQERLVKKVTALYQVTQDIAVGGIEAPFTPADPQVPQVARVDSIAVPRHFDLVDTAAGISGIDTLLRLSGTVTKTGVRLDSPAGLQLRNTLHLRATVNKTGFLNLGREWKVQAINSSPYVRTSGLAEIRLQERPNAWNRWIKPLLAALLAAAGTAWITQ